MTAYISGLLLGLSLIVAIGAQNAFVLRQGLRREHVFAVCAVCTVSDAVLIAAGVAGFGALVTALPWLAPVMRYGGVLFLASYGLRSLWAAWCNSSGLDPAADERKSLSATILTCLAFTWLNPHVYLDTVVLLGSIPPAMPASGSHSPPAPAPARSSSSLHSAMARGCCGRCSPIPRHGACWM